MSKLMKYPLDDESCMKIIAIDECVQKFNFASNVSGEEELLSDEGEHAQEFLKLELLVRSENPPHPLPLKNHQS